ncbi:MAG: hypothetical protein HY646_09905 [Acidobacteria bacterium]|nr:hypothetical protein [Acidobacteriota bacterium]
MKRIERDGSFTATDQGGNVRVIEVLVEVLDASSMENPHGETRGLKILKTKDGLNVNHLGNARFQIVQTGQELKADDPEEVKRFSL